MDPYLITYSRRSIWFYDLIRNGAKGVCIPIDLCQHNGPTTSERLASNPNLLMAHGACMTHIKPYSWFPRLILHAYRSHISFLKCLKYTMKGAIYAYRNSIFKD